MTTMTQDVTTVQGAIEATPDDIEAARELPRLLLGRLAGDWHEARGRLDRAEELAELEPSLAPWAELESAALEAAERLLLRAIRAAALDRELPQARGFSLDGSTFLAVGPGDDPAAWRLVVVPGESFDLAREFRADRMPPRCEPTERPAWLLRALAEAGRLGAAEAHRRLFATAGPPRDGWDDHLDVMFREWGRRETSRRLGLAV